MNDAAHAHTHADVFWAVALGEAIRKHLTAFQDQLKAFYRNEAIHWVHPDDFHLTLSFYGAVPRTNLLKVIEDIRNHCRKELAPFCVNLEGLSGFPQARAAHVLFMKVERHPALIRLAKIIEDYGDTLNLQKERYSMYRPHITLGRSYNHRLDVSAWKAHHPETILQIDAVTLFHQKMPPGIQHYKIIETVSLC